ncbi:MAG: hypothetical protein A3C02_03000 [Candidatus Andersenbacteria bacterium RIFCSPHIGHO2_02_FULL_45_11]|nr:MAG: hypothetical protein A2805_01070 [Candidatus Andersenbacteria bacterium RIFCSPHIGHO2_01_FULL_46_36]OGY32684.1 MAG: hypothetical protein A3C02_03000 [Candidatus Andersenbacteria bacterium RIFCSPHIGHO2_02_FULL_45_11]
MIFNYIPVLRSGASCRFPFVNLDVINSENGRLKNVFALVDSGSESNIFRMDVAEELGLDVSSGEKVVFGGYGSGKIDGMLLPVDMQLWLGNTPHRWKAEVIFSDAAKERQVLGQEGFFDQFEITFRRKSAEFEIS